MMTLVSKIALVVAVAGVATAVSTADSLARGKKAAAPAPAACSPWTYKVAACTGNACSMQRCGLSGTWQPSIAWCWKPWCPA
ncbi:hypothetical protein [Pseudorhodoplanes sinuspersici]|uniref:Uncharacterized protein n=1 Tax=Pseudorhodoplanes sinuspersici TaxID=1235591 RepID=A0A1W6ZT15_9HYPH|nr:hypothetical protein [Pseudorhodoplanes sinuspersici]ARQ00500.1 hypothetical protein CAK95_16515 [Pseudorhodoplanes sinuspersici]RKE67315.1 hypothetical protein DFP91_5077 [Pseudorhodoplanes sinuspersici]